MGIIRTTGLAMLLVAALVVPAAAQDVKIEAKPPILEPGRERHLIVPGSQTEKTRPPDADFYRDGTRVSHDPAFFEDFSVETATGRAGVSGWTAPNQPVGAEASQFRSVSGWFALGLSFTWGGPPTRPQAPITR
jgi:hypothetical protein